MLKYLSLFSGIGSPETALKRLNIPYELVGFSEIDKYAIKSYCALHDVSESLNLGDITQIDITQLPTDIDLITHGSPCQDFSIAGKSNGGDKNSGTRSSLMWHTVEICKVVKPKVIVWENVKNVLSNKHKHNLDKYLEELQHIGYKNYYKVLNAKDFGIPQNRERVFVVSILGDEEYEFPKGFKLEKCLKDILEEYVDDKYYLSEKIQKRYKQTKDDDGNSNIIGTTAPDFRTIGQRDLVYSQKGVMGELVATDYKQPKQIIDFPDRLGGCFDTEKSRHQAGSVWNKNGLSPTLDTMQGGYRQPLITEEVKIEHIRDLDYKGWFDIEKRVHSVDELSPTVEARNRSKYLDNTGETFKIRKLTPLECWRLMGFTDDEFNKVKNICSDTQLYKQAGNSIVVNVLTEIFKNLLK